MGFLITNIGKSFCTGKYDDPEARKLARKAQEAELEVNVAAGRGAAKKGAKDKNTRPTQKKTGDALLGGEESFRDGFVKLDSQAPDMAEVMQLKPGVKLVTAAGAGSPGKTKVGVVSEDDGGRMSVSKYQKLVQELDRKM